VAREEPEVDVLRAFYFLKSTKWILNSLFCVVKLNNSVPCSKSCSKNKIELEQVFLNVFMDLDRSVPMFQLFKKGGSGNEAILRARQSFASGIIPKITFSGDMLFFRCWNIGTT